jgi:hypothetical protein
MSTKYQQQQEQLNKISDELTAENANKLWADDFGGVTTDKQTPRTQHDAFPDLISTGLAAGTSNAELLRDQSVIAELERRDPKFKRQQDEKRMDQATNRFKASNPDYVPNAKNYDAVCKYIRNVQLKNPGMDLEDVIEEAYQKGFWTVDNLSTVFQILKAKGRLDLPAEQPKELTTEELLVVTAKVRSGNPGAAVAAYLKFALPEHAADSYSIEDFATGYPNLLHECVWKIFELLNPQLTAAEFKDFYKSMRHVQLPNVAVLSAALQLRTEERLLGVSNPAVTNPTPAPPPEPEGPRELTEAEMRRLPPEELERLIVEQRQAYRAALYSR